MSICTLFNGLGTIDMQAVNVSPINFGQKLLYLLGFLVTVLDTCIYMKR